MSLRSNHFEGDCRFPLFLLLRLLERCGVFDNHAHSVCCLYCTVLQYLPDDFLKLPIDSILSMSRILGIVDAATAFLQSLLNHRSRYEDSSGSCFPFIISSSLLFLLVVSFSTANAPILKIPLVIPCIPCPMAFQAAR